MTETDLNIPKLPKGHYFEVCKLSKYIIGGEGYTVVIHREAPQNRNLVPREMDDRTVVTSAPLTYVNQSHPIVSERLKLLPLSKMNIEDAMKAAARQLDMKIALAYTPEEIQALEDAYLGCRWVRPAVY